MTGLKKNSGIGGKWKLTPYAALAVYVFIFYMTQPTGNYFQIYLSGIGLNKTKIGFITGTASAIALVFQPILGGIADASSSKKRLLAIIAALSAVAFVSIRINNAVIWILIFYAVYHCCHSFVATLSTSIPVEYCQSAGRPYGVLRMLGALGYSIMMIYVGSAAEKDVRNVFVIFPVICAISLIALIPVPNIRGENNKNSKYGKVSPFVLIKDKKLVHLILFQTLVSVSAGISNNYFSIYFTEEMNGSAQLFGTMTAVAALCELPFLFFADKMLEKLGPRKILMLLCTCNAVKNIMFFAVRSAEALFVVRCFNFFNVTESVCYSLILIKTVQPQLKTSAQTLSTTAQNVAGMLFSSYLGGFLADKFGIRPLFAVSAVLIFVVALVFTQFILKKDFDQYSQKENSV